MFIRENMPPKRNQKRSKNRSKNSSEAVEKNAIANDRVLPNDEEAAVEENAMSDCVLPNEIMLSILSRLPVKSLVRFKCVCKPWYSLVSKPSFVKIHSHQFPHTPKTFSVQSLLLKCPILGIDPPKKLALVSPDSLAEILLDSCNGLVCMGRPFFTNAIILWNPATSFWKVLPPSSTSISGVVTMVSLGFGCNADGDDFKVVRIYVLKGKKMRARVQIEVYSSKSDSWTAMEAGFKFKVLEPKNHVIVNGNPYWIVSLDDRDGVAHRRDDAALLGFDSTLNVFKLMPLPDTENLGRNSALPFVDWEGYVAVIASDFKNGDWLKGVSIWVYDDAEKKWRLESKFGGIGVRAEVVLDSSEAGKIIGGCPNGRLFIYDPKKNCVRVSEMRRRKGCAVQIFPYDESLVHLKGMVPVVVEKEDHGDKFNDIDGFCMSSLHVKNGEITCYFALAF